ncbi:MAG: PQQ-binding-like beta-propeller repeat protein [Deltaproteobacteria bacterium]|nr:PQQ-binding-like beta-propeller repeat protein [Deltaproteobacteria bacterium]
MTYKRMVRRQMVATLALMSTMLSSRVSNAAGPPDTDWLSYNGTVNGQRYSPLDQINVQNVASLAEVCRLKVDDSGTFQAGPLQIDGTLYLTNSYDTLAVDATNCTVRWRNVYKPEQEGVFLINRGVAFANGKLFRGTPDSRLLAIDAATGKTLWQQQVGDPTQGEFFSSVPVIWQGLLIVGSAGSDWGIRGRIMAYEQESGREVWRFYTIPRGNEVGAETWKDRNSARYGGGGSWTTYTLDMASGEVFVPVGNPAPDFVPSHRPGANLFSDSMVVLDARTGALKWWHQMLPNDGLDLDLAAAPMLYWNRAGEPMVAIGSKDGYLYGVNRETQKRIFLTPVTTIKKPDRAPTSKGVYTCPGPLGGVEWNGPAYDHGAKQIVVGSVDWCSILKSDEVDYQPGKFFVAGSWEPDPTWSGWVTAVDPDSGTVRWKYHADTPVVAGITPTAGGVTFTGDMGGNFLALESATGKLLLKTATGGSLAGGVITYALDGKQYVALTSGNVSRMSFGEGGKPTLILYALADGARSAAPVPAQQSAAPTVPTTVTAAASTPDAGRGKELFGKNCAACHGRSGEGGTGPALTGIRSRLDFAATVNWIENPSAKMPRLYPSTFDAQAVVDVAAYVQGF